MSKANSHSKCSWFYSNVAGFMAERSELEVKPDMFLILLINDYYVLCAIIFLYI